VSVGPPEFRPFIVPLALILVLLSGVGPIIAWRRVTWPNMRRSFTFPTAVAALALLLLLLGSATSRKPFALAMFVLATFVVASVVQELWRGASARRALTGDPPTLALLGLIRRNRRRYGGYIAHAGLAVLLIGVAASSSFAHSQHALLGPGQRVRLDGYTFSYLRPTARADAGHLSFGAMLDVSKGGKHITTVSTARRFYPATADPAAGPISIAFNGSADSQVGLRAGLTRDIWTVINPSLQPLQGEINRGDQVFTKLMTSLTPAQARQPANMQFIALQRQRAVSGLASRYVTHPWPVSFLLIVSPLVSWIWLGALIIACGGLIALWPAPSLLARRIPLPFLGRRPAAAMAAKP
jgi:cytochrome c-type biogenesis protein CcmF